MMNPETVEEIHYALFYKQQGQTRKQIAESLGITESLVKTRLGRARSAIVNGLLPVEHLQDKYPILVHLEEAQLEQRYSDQHLVENKQTRFTLRRDNFLEDMLKGFENLQPPMAPPIILTPEPKDEADQIWAVVSDLHIGKRTPEYNSQLACRTLIRFVQKVVFEAQQRGITHLNLAFIGDILDGVNIYPSQVTEVDLSGVEQVVKTVQVAADCLKYALDKGFTVDFIGVRGNHGDISRKDRMAEWENFEYLTYKILESWFRQDSRVKFVIQEREEFWVLHKHVFYFHGHEITGAGSVDGVVNRVRRWIDDISANFNVAVCGHFHRLSVGTLPRQRLLLINGTGTRADGFVRKFGAVHANRWWSFIGNIRSNGELNVTHLLPVSLIPEPF